MNPPTIDELMSAPVTDELIREVSKRVWEAMGNCAHRKIVAVGCKVKDCNGSRYYCPECKPENKHAATICDQADTRAGLREIERVYGIPDITKPENFWPLVEECELEIGPDYAIVDDKYGISTTRTKAWWWAKQLDGDIGAQHKLPGLAVAFAYLKTKEQENER
jgi:hypothetical protein